MSENEPGTEEDLGSSLYEFSSAEEATAAVEENSSSASSSNQNNSNDNNGDGSEYDIYSDVLQSKPQQQQQQSQLNQQLNDGNGNGNGAGKKGRNRNVSFPAIARDPTPPPSASVSNTDSPSFHPIDHQSHSPSLHPQSSTPPYNHDFSASSSSNISSSSGAADNEGHSVYVENLPIPISEQELRDMFGVYGQLNRIHINADKKTGKQLGFAFINYVTYQDAQTAIEQLHNSSQGGRQIRCRHAKPKVPVGTPKVPKPNQPQSSSTSSSLPSSASNPTESLRNLYFAGIPLSWTKVELDEVFGRFGTVVESKILFDLNSGLSKGAGFVKFVDEASAKQAIDELNGTMQEGGAIPMSVRIATPKSLNQMSQMNQQSSQSQSQQQNSNNNPMSAVGLPLSSVLPNAAGGGTGAGTTPFQNMGMGMGMANPLGMGMAGLGGLPAMALLQQRLMAGAGMGMGMGAAGMGMMGGMAGMAGMAGMNPMNGMNGMNSLAGMNSL